MHNDIPQLRQILKSAKTIAVVGLSAQWNRPSYFAAKYMQEHGYKIIPVNPRYAGQGAFAAEDILGQKNIFDHLELNLKQKVYSYVIFIIYLIIKNSLLKLNHHIKN